jgi:hypothetical protein
MFPLQTQKSSELLSVFNFQIYLSTQSVFHRRFCYLKLKKCCKYLMRLLNHKNIPKLLKINKKILGMDGLGVRN